MNVFELRNQVIEDHASYIRSFVEIRDARIRDLVERELSAGFLWPQPLVQLHRHQVDGIRAARRGDSYILTTGTGSGKSLAYIVPIVTTCATRAAGRGSTGVWQGPSRISTIETNVPKVESDEVVKALRDRKHLVEYTIYPNEGHGFTRRENRLDSMSRTVARNPSAARPLILTTSAMVTTPTISAVIWRT